MKCCADYLVQNSKYTLENYSERSKKCQIYVYCEVGACSARRDHLEMDKHETRDFKNRSFKNGRN